MTATERPSDLLPCPWCGEPLDSVSVSEGSTFRWRKVDGCCTDGPEVRHDTLAKDQNAAEADSKRRASEAWNTRKVRNFRTLDAAPADNAVARVGDDGYPHWLDGSPELAPGALLYAAPADPINPPETDSKLIVPSADARIDGLIRVGDQFPRLFITTPDGVRKEIRRIEYMDVDVNGKDKYPVWTSSLAREGT